MVVSVAVQMLHVLSAARAAELSRAAFSVISVIHEPKHVETALVCPEIFVLVAGHHYAGLAAGILFSKPFARIVHRRDTESIHQVNRRSAPLSPEVTCLRETDHSEVRLESVLLRPWVTSGRPHP